MSLLGQGERCHVDARFKTPSSTLYTYWRALRSNDVATVSECFTEPTASLPFPGMLWFLPPVDEIDLRSMNLVKAEAGHLTAVYEVEFRPTGTLDLQSFVTASELKRVGHEWRIVPPTGEAAMPTWKPYRTTVDI